MNQNSKSKITAAGLLVALGIIYGDIGTSPLYALRAILGERPITEDLVYGGVSCILWTLIFQTTIKYIWLTLKADNHGEGGIFSLFALVKRYGKHLVIPTILGATTLLADGIITPPISVASAIEGLNLVPALQNIIVPGNHITIGLVIVILSLLFFFQRFGTQRIGSLFGPIMTVWFAMLLVVGLYQISLKPDILKAANPIYAWKLLTEYPHGFWLLGAVFLCTTGAEALYSDLGHCGRKNIRITWGFVKTSLVIAYFGQAAWALRAGGPQLNGKHPFFECIPDWFLIPSIIIATAATIIASQALISGSYTLISEAINLNFWPRVTVKQPTESKGQIYIPSVNAILWFGCVLMILYFKESSHMEAAYGFSITITMMMTTFLLGHFLYYRLKWGRVQVLALMILFGTIELAFFIANVAKIKERWMFLFFELFIFLVMYVWYYARKVNNQLTEFTDLGKHIPLLKQLNQDPQVAKYATHLIYLTKANNRHEIEEKIVQSILSKRPKRADVYWFVHIHRTDDPYTLNYEVDELVDDCIIRVQINTGFRVTLRTEAWFKKIVADLQQCGDLKLQEKLGAIHPYHNDTDFRFVVIEKYLSAENDFGIRQGLLIKSYFTLKHISLSDEKAFGLEKPDVDVEYLPLVLRDIPIHSLQRI